jgi:arylsulfatase A-like enzyme
LRSLKADSRTTPGTKAEKEKAMNTARNVLIFCVDEMRADHLSCMGNPLVNTPNLDRLAARGTVFRRAYCNNPICMPARATMFTGLLPRDHGVRINGQNLRRDIPTLADVLRNHGYRTHSAGKLHLTGWVPEVQPPDVDRYPECMAYWQSGDLHEFPEPYFGFETVDFVGGHVSWVYGAYMEWLKANGGDPEQLKPAKALAPLSGAPTCFKLGLPEELHYNRYIADSTRRVIAETPADQPFFIWCSFPDPHTPVAPPAPYCDMYDPEQVKPPAKREGELDDLPPFYRDVIEGRLAPNGSSPVGVTEAHWREMIALTYGMVTHVDTEVGRVLDALEESGRLENTLVVFTTDHGDMMGDHGLLWKAYYTFRGSVHIPMIATAPRASAGQACDSLVCQIDLMPSVLDYCGLPMPGQDGQDAETPFERGAVAPLMRYPGRSWMPLLSDGALRVRDCVVIENDDPTTGLQVRCLVTDRHRLSIYPGFADGELFDLERDPDELHNLWYKPEARDLRLQLQARLMDAYAAETPWYPIPPWNA